MRPGRPGRGRPGRRAAPLAPAATPDAPARYPPRPMTTFKLRLPALLIACVFALVTIGTWAWLNRPESEPEWPHRVWGFALSPYQADQNAIKEEYPTREEIASDLDVLKGKTQAIRTYTVAGTIGLVPELAAVRGLNVALGVWIDS